MHVCGLASFSSIFAEKCRWPTSRSHWARRDHFQVCYLECEFSSFINRIAAGWKLGCKPCIFRFVTGKGCMVIFCNCINGGFKLKTGDTNLQPAAVRCTFRNITHHSKMTEILWLPVYIPICSSRSLVCVLLYVPVYRLLCDPGCFCCCRLAVAVFLCRAACICFAMALPLMVHLHCTTRNNRHCNQREICFFFFWWNFLVVELIKLPGAHAAYRRHLPTAIFCNEYLHIHGFAAGNCPPETCPTLKQQHSCVFWW